MKTALFLIACVLLHQTLCGFGFGGWAMTIISNGNQTTVECEPIYTATMTRFHVLSFITFAAGLVSMFGFVCYLFIFIGKKTTGLTLLSCILCLTMSATVAVTGLTIHSGVIIIGSGCNNLYMFKVFIFAYWISQTVAILLLVPLSLCVLFCCTSTKQYENI